MPLESVSLESIHALQNIIGVISKRKVDWSSVCQYFLADLLNLLPSLEVDLKQALTTSLLPLVDMLEKHNVDYLAANLPPATAEIFKHVMSTHSSTFKFKGKV